MHLDLILKNTLITLTFLKLIEKAGFNRNDVMVDIMDVMIMEESPPRPPDLYLVRTCDVLYTVGPHVQHDGAVEDAAAQLKQAVERQRGHVGLAPPLPAILHILLKLQPPARHTHTRRHKTHTHFVHVPEM